MTRLEAQRRYKVRKDQSLINLRARQVEKIKKQRSAYQKKKQSRLKREAVVTGKQDGKLQKKLTDKQLRRRNKSIKRDIAKTKKLKYKKTGGDIAFKISEDK